MNFSIDQTTWARDSLALKYVRTQVFLIEQAVPEDDEWDQADEHAIHFLVRNENAEPIGCARLLTEMIDGQPCFHIGRVAILLAHRSSGIGTALMQTILQYCLHDTPQNPIFLNAQISKQAFYRRLHFVSRGEIFMDANIPHIEMWYTP